jgi:hypothetical protein
VFVPWDAIYIMYVSKSPEPNPLIDFSCLPVEIVVMMLEVGIGDPILSIPPPDAPVAPVAPVVKPRGGLRLVQDEEAL